MTATSSTRMHADEVEIDETLVRRLLGEQFPNWVDRPLHRVEPEGTDNAIFRLGDDLAVRLARRRGPTQPGGKLFDWLPTLAPLLPVAIPIPGRERANRRSPTPGSGRSTPGSRTRRYRSRRSTQFRRRATLPRSWASSSS